MKKAHIFLIALSLLALQPQNSLAQGFQGPGTEVSVRDLLEGQKRAPRSDTYYLIALSETQKNNIPAAEKAIKTGLQINPRNTRLMNLQGAIFARQGKLADARRTFLTVLQLDSEDKYAATSLRTIENQMQPKRQEMPVFNRPSASPAPDAPLAPVNVQKTPQPEQKVLEATYFIEMKDKQQCFHGMSAIKRGQERFLADNPQRKSEFSTTTLVGEGFLTSAPICPNGGAYSWENNDVICSKHGKMAEIGSEVSNVFSEFNNGMRSKLSRNYLDALRSFEQVVVLYPRWAEAHFQLGDTLFRLGETDPAIASIRNCLKHDAGNVDAQLLLANLYFKKGQKDAALQLLDQVVEKHKGTVYSMAARSVATSIRSGRNYYQIFPPN